MGRSFPRMGALGSRGPVGVRTMGTPPDAPGGIAWIEPMPDHIPIAWWIPANVETYDLYRKTGAGGSWGLYQSDLVTNSYDDYAVSPGIYYYYKVKAKNNFGESPYSPECWGYIESGA